MPIPNPSSSLPPNSSCPTSILIRGITPKPPSSSSSPDGYTSSPLLEFSPTLTTIPLHLWINLPWVPSPISALLGTPIQLARYPAAAANVNNINTDRFSSTSSASGARVFPAGMLQNGKGVQQTEAMEEEEEAEEDADGDGDFQPIAPLLPFFLETDPEDVATFGKVRLNWLQGTVLVSSSPIPTTTTTTTTTTPSDTPETTPTTAKPFNPTNQATELASSSSSTQCPDQQQQKQQLQPLHPRLLAQMVQYLNGPVFRAIKAYRTLDLGSAEKKTRAREIRAEMFSPQAFEGWVSRGGNEGDRAEE
ncbi:hypothetical protein NU195Hw_g129t1 [Hortaea werneckii]